MTASDRPPTRDADAGPAACRNTLRRDLIARRMALPSDTHAALSAAIRQRLDGHFPALAQSVAAFCWPVQNEPDLLPLVGELVARGGRVALPVVVRPGEPLAFREWWPGQPLAPDRYDIPTPTDGDFVTPQVLLLPVNAFDADGYRIGYGGGFFDRTLAALDPVPLAIGVGFDFQEVATTHPQPHDRPLDAIVTESRILRRR